MEAATHSRRADVLRQLAGGFTGSHDELLASLDGVRDLAQLHHYITAAKQLGQFRIQQERHIAWEEALLAELEAHLGQRPSIAEARGAHRRVLELLREASAALSAWEGPRFLRVLERLRTELQTHWRHETEVLCNDFARMLDELGTDHRVWDALRRK